MGRKRGRPVKDRDVKYSKRAYPRYTEEQYKKLEANANKLGIDLSVLIREASLQGIKNLTPKSEIFEESQTLDYEDAIRFLEDRFSEVIEALDQHKRKPKSIELTVRRNEQTGTVSIGIKSLGIHLEYKG